MNGLMMNFPLTLTHFLERSARLFPSKEIASRRPDGEMHRYTYAEFNLRVHRLAHLLGRLGLEQGDRVGTLCWNSHRHLELYFAVPCYGGVLHTLNLRLAADQLAFIINHGGDRVIFCDASLLPLLEPIRDQIPCVRRIIVLPDEGAGDYEELLVESPAEPFPWPRLDENAACAICYTSGTTGNPKGVLYSHRAIVLHSFASSAADVFAVSESDTIGQFIPMFHANGWGVPFTAIMNGSKLVLSGRQLAPADLAFLIESERITFTGGVPTLWMTLYSYLQSNPRDISSLRMIVVGGSAMPREFIELYATVYGVNVVCLWGMTETTPVATFMHVKQVVRDRSGSERFDLLARHGMAAPGVELRIIDENAQEIPWDGVTMGEWQVRGPWVTSGYFKDELNHVNSPTATSFMDGWFRTGDVATIDEHGYIQIMDRTKDLVKSGGEWISSVDLENAIMAHPKVMEAAVIAVPHPKWQERPLALVAPHRHFRDSITKQEILSFLTGRVAKWWLPDDVVFIDSVPKTSVGKFNKRALRERFKDYVLPDQRSAQAT
jgi:fatty-acyl-CoA synthase